MDDDMDISDESNYQIPDGIFTPVKNLATAFSNRSTPDCTMLSPMEFGEKQQGGICGVRTVPALVFSIVQSPQTSTSGSRSSVDDLRTPGVLASPAPSPVFELDEGSRDSGYGDENTGTSADMDMMDTTELPAARVFTKLRAPLKPVNRCHSESEALPAWPWPKDENAQLIGDHSMTHALPIMERAHVHDLKCINSETLKRLVSGEFNDSVQNYTLVDCRYPYEYGGGHIKGAVNLYRDEELIDHMFKNMASGSSGDGKRSILVFYCEYSRERGPSKARLLRKYDRQLNEQQYPKLFYPEIYLLDGGYKNFYSACSELCQPRSYLSMHDENHTDDLRKFRSKSKSWTSGAGGGDGASENPFGRRRIKSRFL